MADDVAGAVDTAMARAHEAIEQFAGTLAGTGSQVADAYRDLQQCLRALPMTAVEARGAIASVEAREDLPKEFRNKYAIETQAGAVAVVEGLREAANALADRLEGALGQAMMPPPARDIGERQLRRSELGMMLGGASGPALIPRLLDLVGNDPALDGELLEGTFVRALLVANGLGGELGAFYVGARAKLVNRPAYSEKAAAAQQALIAFKKLNIRGYLPAFHVAAKLTLG